MVNVDVVANSIARIGTAGGALDESQLADVLIACGWESAEPAASPPHKFVHDQLKAFVLNDVGPSFVVFEFRQVRRDSDEFLTAVENDHVQQVAEMQEIRSQLLASVSSGQLGSAGRGSSGGRRHRDRGGISVERVLPDRIDVCHGWGRAHRL